MRCAVIGAAGVAGRRHWATFDAAGYEFIDCLDKGDNWKQAVREADVVSICTPDDLHAEMTCFALAAGKHVLCEKPLSHRMDELEQIEECVRKADGQTFGTNFPLRHLKCLPYDKAYLIECLYERGRLRTEWRSEQWYSLIVGGGIHLVDLIIRNWHGEIKQAEPVFTIDNENGRIYEQGVFIRGEMLIRITCDFGFIGPHRVSIIAHTAMGQASIFREMDEDYDKTSDIRQFIADVESGQPGNGADAIRANRICIQMSQPWRLH